MPSLLHGGRKRHASARLKHGHFEEDHAQIRNGADCNLFQFCTTPRFSSSSALRCCGAIAIDECHQSLREIGEQLKLSGVQWLAQRLKEEGVRAVRERRSQAAEEKAETASGIGQERKAGIADRGAELHSSSAQCPHVAQCLAEFDGSLGADPLEMDRTIAAIIELDAGRDSAAEAAAGAATDTSTPRLA